MTTPTGDSDKPESGTAAPRPLTLLLYRSVADADGHETLPSAALLEVDTVMDGHDEVGEDDAPVDVEIDLTCSESAPTGGLLSLERILNS